MTSVTKELIESKIKSVIYINAGLAAENEYGDSLAEKDLRNLSLVTICFIILENGFKVEGVSACVDPAMYDENKGRLAAYENAFAKIWQLEGYMLKQHLHEQEEIADLTLEFDDSDCDGCKI